jgi:hypothetical protein
MRYIIRNISVWSAFKFGIVIGGVLSFFPGLTIGLILRSVVHSLSSWLESWLSLDIPVVGSYSLLDAVNLQDFLTGLQQFDDRSWLMTLLLVLLIVFFGGLIVGLLSALGAVIYNLVAALTGGMIVQADALGAHTPAPIPLSVPAPLPSGGAYPPVAASVPPVRPAPAAEPAGWLVAQATQHRWPIGQSETRIGSGLSNQIVLDGLSVNHAAIRWENGRFILHDYSGGQTWVNGRSLVGPNMIKSGFQIRLANQEFLFQS